MLIVLFSLHYLTLNSTVDIIVCTPYYDGGIKNIVGDIVDK